MPVYIGVYDSRIYIHLCVVLYIYYVDIMWICLHDCACAYLHAL